MLHGALSLRWSSAGNQKPRRRSYQHSISTESKRTGAAQEPERTYGRNHRARFRWHRRSEEHTSELQSHSDLVCRLLLEKKKNKKKEKKIRRKIIDRTHQFNDIVMT